jgi:hypothetical protein
MSASNRPNHIYLVMDAGTPVAAFTARPALQVYLRHRIGSTRSSTRWSIRSGATRARQS